MNISQAIIKLGKVWEICAWENNMCFKWTYYDFSYTSGLWQRIQHDDRPRQNHLCCVSVTDQVSVHGPARVRVFQAWKSLESFLHSTDRVHLCHSCTGGQRVLQPDHGHIWSVQQREKTSKNAVEVVVITSTHGSHETFFARSVRGGPSLHHRPGFLLLEQVFVVFQAER
jgi:hypothetical protein